MNHNKAFRKLGRNPAHRRALMRNLATSLMLHDRIETTLPKAKELKRVADKLVTLGKKNTLHSRRQAMRFLNVINRQESGNAQKTTAVHRLFEEIAPRYAERNGGYTRVLHGRKNPLGKALNGRRDGDNAEMAVIEFVEPELQKKEKKRKRRVRRAASDEKPAVIEAAAEAPVEAEEAQVAEEVVEEAAAGAEEESKDK